MKKGIKNLKIAGENIIRTMDIADDISADGKYDLSDLQYIPGAIPVVPALITSVPFVPAEILDLDDEEETELIAHYKQVLEQEAPDLGKDKLETYAYRALEIIADQASVVSKGMSLWKDIKADTRANG